MSTPVTQDSGARRGFAQIGLPSPLPDKPLPFPLCCQTINPGRSTQLWRGDFTDPKSAKLGLAFVLTAVLHSTLTFFALQQMFLQGAGRRRLALHRAGGRADTPVPIRLVFAPHFFLPEGRLCGWHFLRTRDVAAGHRHLRRARLLGRKKKELGSSECLIDQSLHPTPTLGTCGLCAPKGWITQSPCCRFLDLG